ERFAVRNSGAIAVVEGIGDHGCEYMTGGKVAVLGKTGRNFAAGMSGGVAFVYDKNAQFSNGLCNLEMVDLEKLTDTDQNELKQLIQNHKDYTNSHLAKKLLENWEQEVSHFIKVFPKEYKIALNRLAKEKAFEIIVA
ncbi:MAG: hypothetical protein CO023_01125, partial [Flavobacteriales bacterium CG_4_9_14_0_2_um_filter_35_242]